MTRRELRQGNVESVFQIAMVAHHLITFGRECLTRDVQASAYSARGREERTQGARVQRGLNGKPISAMSVYLKRFMRYKWGKDVFLHSTKIGFPLSQRIDF